jgi:hypothetical protein
MGSASVKPAPNGQAKPKQQKEGRRNFSPMSSVPPLIVYKDQLMRSNSFARPSTSKSGMSTVEEESQLSPEPGNPKEPTVVEDLEFAEEKIVNGPILDEPVSTIQSAPMTRQRKTRTRVIKSLKSINSFDIASDVHRSKKNKDDLREVMTWIFEPHNHHHAHSSDTKSTNVAKPKHRSHSRPAGVYEHNS